MDINDINLDSVLRAPDWAKAVTLLVITALLAGGFWYFLYKPHAERVAQMEKRVQSLKAQYQQKKRQVGNLPALREHFQELQERMEGSLEQLPDRTEIPELIDDIDRVGRAEGLKFKLFEPKPEKRKDFYAEKPVALQVQGSYNAIGRFLAATASLPRIVNVGGLSLSGSEGGLTLKATARTFRYLSESELEGGN